MKNAKPGKLARRILSIVLTVALVIGLMPGNVMTVSAEETPYFTEQPTEDNAYTVEFNHPNATLQWCKGEVLQSDTYSQVEVGTLINTYEVKAGESLIASADTGELVLTIWNEDEEYEEYLRLDFNNKTASITFDSDETVNVGVIHSVEVSEFKLEHLRYKELADETDAKLQNPECETIYICKAKVGDNVYYSDIVVTEKHNYIGGKCTNCNAYSYAYDEKTNTYAVYKAEGMQEVIDAAETAENPVIIKLMENLAVPGVVANPEFPEIIDYALLIEEGVMTIDLNGHTLSNSDAGVTTIQIGVENAESWDAVVTIIDSSGEDTGAINSNWRSIVNYCGTLIVESGKIMVDSNATACGITNMGGVLTINGGTVMASSTALYDTPYGIESKGTYVSEERVAASVTVNGGEIGCNGSRGIGIGINESSLVITDGTITGDWYAVDGSNETISIIGGSFTGGTADIFSSSDSAILDIDDEGGGATFPDGITVDGNVTLSKILADGVCYFDAQGNRVEVDESATSITDKGTISIMACEHPSFECTASENVITGNCPVCTGGTATITATDKTYDSAPAEIEVEKTGALKNEPLAITYAVKGGSILDSAPVNVGTYTASIKIGDVTASKDYVISKAEKAPNMPEAAMSVSYSQKTVGDVELPEDWIWSEAASANGLTVGKAVEATAIYNGADKGNYVTESVSVSITRQACTHTYSEPTFAWMTDGRACNLVFNCIIDGCSDTLMPFADKITSEVKIEATCKEKGTTTYTATYTDTDKVYSAEGKTYTDTKEVADIPVDSENHTGETEVKNAKEATCGEEGYTGDTYCKDCGAKTATGKAIEKKPHAYGEPTFSWSEDGKRAKVIFTCENDATHKVSHDATVTSEVKIEATCKEKGTTTYTATYTDTDKVYSAEGKTYTDTKEVADIPVDSENHTGETEVKNAKEATCGEEGYTGDTYCKDCGVKTATGKAIEKKPHAYGEPTFSWSEDGKSAQVIFTCENDATHKVSHDATVTSEVKIEATCNDKGTTTYTAKYIDADKVYSAEGKAYTDTKDVADIPADEKLHEESDILYTGEGEKAPTCTEAGIGHTECTKCKEPMQTNVTVEAFGHTGGTATCKNKAECSTCHEGYGELDKNNHAGETEVKDAKEATCGEEGYTGDTYCKDCGVKTATGKAIEKKPHTYGEPTFDWSEDGKSAQVIFTCENDATHKVSHDATVTSEVKIEATCNDKGTTTYTAKYIDVDKVYSAEGKAYTDTKDVADIPADEKLHEESDILYTGEGEKAPTCTEAGIGHTECTKCKEPMQTNVTVEAFGHTGETEVKDAKKATCAVDGYTGDTYCKDCGAKIATGTKIDKSIAHTWDKGVVTKEATATEKGEKTYTCSVCKTTKKEEIPALGAPKVGEEIASEDGSATYKVTEAGENGNSVTYKAPTDKNQATVVVPATVTIDNITYNVTTISDTAFAGNKKLTSVTIGDNVTGFSDKTFKGCSNLKTVDVGNGVTSIPANAFKNFKKLTTVKMGTGVKTIGKNTFYGCKKLKNLTIGKNVVTIGDKAFYKCTSLTKLTIPSKVKTIGKSAFYGCSKTKTLTIKSSKLTTKKIGSKAFTKTPKSMTVKVPKKKFKTYKSMLIKKGVNKKASFKKS